MMIFQFLIWIFAEGGGVVCAVFQVDVKETVFMIPRCALPRRRHWGYLSWVGFPFCLKYWKVGNMMLRLSVWCMYVILNDYLVQVERRMWSSMRAFVFSTMKYLARRFG